MRRGGHDAVARDGAPAAAYEHLSETFGALRADAALTPSILHCRHVCAKAAQIFLNHEAGTHGAGKLAQSEIRAARPRRPGVVFDHKKLVLVGDFRYGAYFGGLAA
jgi:hypothetical protein